MTRRSLGEWAVLGLLAEAPAHPFALARELEGDDSPGRVFTIRRPLVYRAVERLVADRLITPDRTEPGEAGPERTVYRITTEGSQQLEAWLVEPVAHIRDLRLAFLLKVVLARRAGRSPVDLVQAQQRALAPVLDSLTRMPDDPDAIELWRHHSAVAAGAFLAELLDRTR
jgi:PadR family transcriptional regulator AphA